MHTVKEMRSQLELWKQYFMDIVFEINDLQGKTGDYISQNNSKKGVFEAENFQNEFISHQESITNIIERIRLCDDSLNGKDPDMLIEDDQILKCTKLHEEMDQFQNLYLTLKENFKQKMKVFHMH